MAGFCNHFDIESEIPQVEPFSTITTPPLRTVNLWIETIADEMRDAIASGGMDPVDEPLPENTAIWRWFRKTNMEGVKRQLGQYLYSYNAAASDVQIPWQDDYGPRLERLKRGNLIFANADIAAKKRWGYQADEEDA